MTCRRARCNVSAPVAKHWHTDTGAGLMETGGRAWRTGTAWTLWTRWLLGAFCGCRTGATAGPAASASGAAGRRHGDGGRADGRCGAAHRSDACGRRCRHVGVAGRAGRAAAHTQALASPRRPPCLRSTPSTLREARRLLPENRKRVLQFSNNTYFSFHLKNDLHLKNSVLVVN